MIRNLRRFAVPAGLAAAAVLLSAPAHAASPQPEKFSFTDTFTEEDFCGTDADVTTTVSVKAIDFHNPKRGEFASVVQGKQTFTDEGKTVIGHFAGRLTGTIVSGEVEGAHTIALTHIGLPEQFRVKGGGVITRDTGRITFLVTVDEDGDFVSEEILRSGPHPQADSGFTLFCDVIPEALGIE